MEVEKHVCIKTIEPPLIQFAFRVIIRSQPVSMMIDNDAVLPVEASTHADFRSKPLSEAEIDTEGMAIGAVYRWMESGLFEGILEEYVNDRERKLRIAV